MDMKIRLQRTKMLVNFKQQEVEFLRSVSRCTRLDKIKNDIHNELYFYLVSGRIDNFREKSSSTDSQNLLVSVNQVDLLGFYVV
jgi:hypothetical protein